MQKKFRSPNGHRVTHPHAHPALKAKIPKMPPTFNGGWLIVLVVATAAIQHAASEEDANFFGEATLGNYVTHHHPLCRRDVTWLRGRDGQSLHPKINMPHHTLTCFVCAHAHCG